MTYIDKAAVVRLVVDVMVTSPKVHEPVTTVGEIRALFEDEHVHLALVVTVQQRLVTTIGRADLPGTAPSLPAADVGTVAGRTVAPTTPLDTATGLLRTTRRRRLAVTDDADRLLGLLCLKRDGNGFCTDEGIRAQAARRGYK
jgi:CBS-domain-containing membrane protein